MDKTIKKKTCCFQSSNALQEEVTTLKIFGFSDRKIKELILYWHTGSNEVTEVVFKWLGLSDCKV
jgi:hypothetical protein